jgi:enolase
LVADLTVALQTGHLKSGAPFWGERVAKYNRLMDIKKSCERTASNIAMPEKASEQRTNRKVDACVCNSVDVHAIC